MQTPNVNAEANKPLEAPEPSSPGELSRTILSATAFFLLLCSYYILRPVRDEMAAQTGADRVPWLFTGTFLCMLAAVPLFGWIVKRCPRGAIVPLTYGVMTACLLGFYLAFSGGIGKGMAAVFFMWTSLFNLTVISLFWSSVGDAFTTSQARRCYGFITAGGTAGAITGPALTALLARRAGTANLLLISATLLVAATAMLFALRRLLREQHAQTPRPIGGSIFAGVTETVAEPLLRGLAGLVICYSAVSTVLYVEVTSLAGRIYADPATRTEFFARIDLAVNVVALASQLFAVRPLIQRAGVGWALSLPPAMMFAAMLTIGVRPEVGLFALAQVIHRAAEFSLSKPGREILFTTVNAERRYKAKNFIDTAVYRANDTATAWAVRAVSAQGLSAVWWIAVPATLAWLALSRFVARREKPGAPVPLTFC